MSSSVVKILLLIFLVQTTFGDIQNYTCDITDETCILQNLFLTSDDKHFKLEPNHVISEIEDVWIRFSRVDILTSDICQTLPYVKVFDSSKVGLVSIDGNALTKCTKLETIDLSLNALTTLPPGIFFWNGELKYVYLWNNRLTEIDESLFKYNDKLIKVALNGNLLKTVPSNVFSNLINLKSLWLQGNQLSEALFLEEPGKMKNLAELRLDFNKLSDIDVLILYRNFPSLKEINLNENEFWCPRMLEISENLTKFGIKYDAMSRCIEDKKEWKQTKNKRAAERVEEKKKSAKIQEKQVQVNLNQENIVQGKRQTLSVKDEL